MATKPSPEEIIALQPLYGQTPSCPDGVGMERAFRLIKALTDAGYEINEAGAVEKIRERAANQADAENEPELADAIRALPLKDTGS